MAASFVFVQYKGKTLHLVRARDRADAENLYKSLTLCGREIGCDTTPGSGEDWQEVEKPAGALVCSNCMRVRLAWYPKQ